jgi:hypothetical protein
MFGTWPARRFRVLHRHPKAPTAVVNWLAGTARCGTPLRLPFASGLLWHLVIDAHAASGISTTDTLNRAKKWAPGLCVWCASDDQVELYTGEPRCALCREKEEIVADARNFMQTYGLRPLGGSLNSEDEEEYEQRVAGRDARRVLNEIKMAELPDPAAVRKALNPSGVAAVKRVQSAAATDLSVPAPARTRAPRAASSSRARKPAAAAAVTETIDPATLQQRVTSLLAQLDTLDAQIAAIGEPAGLAVAARRKNLENSRAQVLRTLAALQKAHIAAAR